MYIGIDIGGTSTRIGRFQSLNTPDFTLVGRYPTAQDYQAQIQAITAAIRQDGDQPIAGIGVSFGGRMAKDGRSVLVAPNLPSYVGQPFAQDLEKHFACPVRLAHDPVCGLLSEKQWGVLRQEDRCAYMTLSTGTGVAFHLGKGENALTVSTETAHQILDGNPFTCLCGQIGCLETHTGGKQLELRLGYSTAQITDPLFWDFFCAKLSLGLVNLTQLTRIEVIAVSGAIAVYNPSLLPLLQQKINAQLRGALLEVRLASLGESAPLIGAAILLTAPENSLIH